MHSELTDINCPFRKKGVNLAYSVPTDVDFNVSGMFAMPTPAANHNNHLDYDSGTVERKRPISIVAPENDATRKDK